MERKIILCDLCNTVITDGIYYPFEIKHTNVDLCSACADKILDRKRQNNEAFQLKQLASSNALKTVIEEQDPVPVEASLPVIEAEPEHEEEPAVIEPVEHAAKRRGPRKTDLSPKNFNMTTQDILTNVDDFINDYQLTDDAGNYVHTVANLMEMYKITRAQYNEVTNRLISAKLAEPRNESEIDEGKLIALYSAVRADGSKWTVKQIASDMGYTDTIIRKRLNKLAEDGKVTLRPKWSR